MENEKTKQVTCEGCIHHYKVFCHPRNTTGKGSMFDQFGYICTLFKEDRFVFRDKIGNGCELRCAKHQFEAIIFKESENRFTAWISEERGIVAQGDSIQEVKDDLVEMLMAKFMIDRKMIKLESIDIKFYLRDRGRESRI